MTSTKEGDGDLGIPGRREAPTDQRSNRSDLEENKENVSDLCRYFASGHCYDLHCAYSHDPALLTAQSRGQTVVCQFFAQGNCRYGDTCRFLHTETTAPLPQDSAMSPPRVLPPPSNLAPSDELSGSFATLSLRDKKSNRTSSQSAVTDKAVKTGIANFKPDVNAPVFVPRASAPVFVPSNQCEQPIYDGSYEDQLAEGSSYDNQEVWYEPGQFQQDVMSQYAVPFGGQSYPSNEDTRDIDQAFPDYPSESFEPTTQEEGSSQVTPPFAKAEKAKSWAHVVNPAEMAKQTIEEAESELCPYSVNGLCRYGECCAYIHGEICEMCMQAVLHPTHERQRKKHEQNCLSVHEAEMEEAFAVAKSKDKTCGICMEVIMDKPVSQARFGIMPNCNHCFCLDCLRTWRKAKQFENKIVRACPECRQTSDYICPSRFWVDTEEEKGKLFSEYKGNLNRKECKYFKNGSGDCPFGNKCFYRHAGEDGQEVDIGPPRTISSRRSAENADGELTMVQSILFYEFLEARANGEITDDDFFELFELLGEGEEEIA